MDFPFHGALHRAFQVGYSCPAPFLLLLTASQVGGDSSSFGGQSLLWPLQVSCVREAAPPGAFRGVTLMLSLVYNTELRPVHCGLKDRNTSLLWCGTAQTATEAASASTQDRDTVQQLFSSLPRGQRAVPSVYSPILRKIQTFN